ncbi:MAG: FAD-dependent oxidoreductase, partial [Acidimicrobiia bacterium]|nr:FAD-dependent oxidoreductase [Acidimicrobiia bacterium]
GRSVAVLEARRRIGGRIWTTGVGDARLDLGASWIHGHVGNPITAYADIFGLAWRLDESWETGSRAFIENQGWANPDLADAAVASQWAFDKSRASEVLDPNRSQNDAVDWFLDEEGLEGQARLLADFRLRHVHADLYTAGPAGRISIGGSALYEEYPGGNALIEGGYMDLIEHLASGIDLFTDHEVTHIDHRGPVTISTNQGVFEARHAIVTLPLGVLQSDAVAFDPPLRGRGEIDRLDMGHLEKLALVFNERWWPTDHKRFMYVSDSFRTPQWIDLTETTGAPTLLAFYNSETSRGWSGLSSDQRCEEALTIIRDMFGPSPDPKATAATDWSRDRFSRGSYSYIPIGSTGEDMDRLAEPQSDHLMLAGEHTVKNHFGTVHAAIESGQRAASLVLGM